MRALGFLFLVVLVVGGIGFARSWWSVSTESHAGETEVSLHIDKDKIGSDTKAATAKIRQKTHELVEKIKKSGGDAVSGAIAGLDGAGLTVAREDGATVRFELDAETLVELDDTASAAADLRAGDAVTVIDEDRDGVADRVIAETGR